MTAERPAHYHPSSDKVSHNFTQEQQEEQTRPLQGRKHRKLLCAGDELHCFNPEERNVFSRPTEPRTIAPSQAPSISPVPTSFRLENNPCESDGQGNYGTTDAPIRRLVDYMYQVETTDVITKTFLNSEVLQDVEKEIGDILVKQFFSEQCSGPTIQVVSFQPHVDAAGITTKQQKPIVREKQEDNNGRLRRILRRDLGTAQQNNLVGLSAAPPDQVLDGNKGRKSILCTQTKGCLSDWSHLTILFYFAEACPFPGTDGLCYVVGGGLTAFGDDVGGNLTWIDESIHAEIQQAMDSGNLGQEIRKQHPDIIAIRFIPVGTSLPDQSTPNPIDAGNNISGKSSSWSWSLIGFGIFLLAGVLLYMVISRRKNRREQDEHNAAVIGAFPIAVSPRQSVSPREKHSSISSEKWLQRCSSRDFFEDGDGLSDDNIPLHVFQDNDETSPKRFSRGVSTGWGQIYDGNNANRRSPFGGGTSISLDPNQPFVRSVLNDEEEDGYRFEQSYSRYRSPGSEGYGSSSYGSSPRHSDTSSPSKLTLIL